MITEAILKPIGNGQITIPLARRDQLGINKKYVKAKLEGNKIIIESLDNKDFSWDVKSISFDELNSETQKSIKNNEKSYKNGEKENFISHNDFWENV